MKITLSVVIPVYKVEKYIVRCVKSVLNQNFTDLEVILVDDGSPDCCPQICDELALQDPRITVIHKKNGGLSSARNEGLKAANGEYVVFLDSDDQWAQNKLSPIMEQVLTTRAQMTFFPSISLYEDAGFFVRENYGFYDYGKEILSPLQIYPTLIHNGDLHEHACTKIIETDYVRKNNLYFKEGILGEDTEWLFRALRTDVNIGITNICLYIYTECRIGSIVNTASTRSVRDTLSTIRSSIDYYKQNPLAKTKDYELAHCAYLWSIALGLYNNVEKEDKRSIKNELVEVGSQLNLESHPKSRKVGKIYKLLGLNATAFFLSYYIKLHRKNLVNKKIKVNG